MHCELILLCLTSPVFHYHPFTFLPRMSRWWVWRADEMSLLIITLFTNPGNQTINTTVHSWVSRTGGHTLPHLARLQSPLAGETGESLRSPGSDGTLLRPRGPVPPGEIVETVCVCVCVFAHATQDQSRIQTWRHAICCSAEQGLFGRWNAKKWTLLFRCRRLKTPSTHMRTPSAHHQGGRKQHKPTINHFSFAFVI